MISYDEVSVTVACSMPHKVTLTPRPVDSETSMGANMATGRVGIQKSHSMYLL